MLVSCEQCSKPWLFDDYPLVNIQKTMENWKITVFHGKIHYKWWFSIVMLNYQRVVGGLYYPSYIGDCNTPQTGNPFFDQPGLNGMTEGSWTLLMWFLCGRRLRINHLQWLPNRWRNKKTLKIGASLLGLRHRGPPKQIETCFPRCYGYLWMMMSLECPAFQCSIWGLHRVAHNFIPWNPYSSKSR